MSTTNSPGGLAGATGLAISFEIGGRTYWLGRDDRRSGYRIVCNGDLVEYASALHYGDVGAFRRIVQRLEAIERDWASMSPNAPSERPPIGGQ